MSSCVMPAADGKRDDGFWARYWDSSSDTLNTVYRDLAYSLESQRLLSSSPWVHSSLHLLAGII